MSLPPTTHWYDITADQDKKIENYFTTKSNWVKWEDFHHEVQLLDEWKGDQFTLNILYRSIDCLKPGQWLNDSVITCYLDLIVNTGGGSFLSLGTHFLDQFMLVGKDREKHLKHLPKSPFSYRVWLWPVFNKDHWCTVAAYPQEGVVIYYDSLKTDSEEARYHCLLLGEWAEMVWRSEKRKTPFPGPSWDLIMVTNGPKQTNVFDGGVYTCQALLELARGAPEPRLAEEWKFKNADMNDLRKIMIEELATRKLRTREGF